MKHKIQVRWLVTFSLPIILALVLLVILTRLVSSVQATTGVWYVAPDSNCSSLTPCFDNIQAAVDAASDHDVIKAAAGIYTSINHYGGLSQTVYISKPISIQGGYTSAFTDPPNPDQNWTVLDAQRKGRVVYMIGSISATLEGLYITNGDAAGLGGGYWPWMDAGGGVYAMVATVIFSHNVVYSNTTPWLGGGLYVSYGNAMLSNNIFHANTAAQQAGGVLLYFTDSILENNVIANNHAVAGPGGIMASGATATFIRNTIANNTSLRDGGGVYLKVEDATFVANTIVGNVAGGDGGGLGISNSNIVLRDNTIAANTSQHTGGGIAASGSMLLLDTDIITNNVTRHASTNEGSGGGLYLEQSNATLINAVIADNQAGAYGSGIFNRGSSSQILYSTTARNTGGDGSGIAVSDVTFFAAPEIKPISSDMILTNTILANQTVGISATANNTITLNSVLLAGNGLDMEGDGIITTTNVYTGDPAFASDGYHLTRNSAAIDRGIPTDVAIDIDGDSRISNAAPDLGADEYKQHEFYLSLVFR